MAPMLPHPHSSANLPTHIGMVAGEPSGDLIAASVIAGLRDAEPGVACTGIGGPRMQAAGFTAWRPMHALTVFGYVDAVKRLPGLLSTYRHVKNRWLAEPPAAFVGIDAPDFNLRLEAQLRAAGIPTVHFVGPSIWAWRYERIHAIRAAVSHMLVLFPFEEAIYRKENIPVTFVGHPLAGRIPLVPDRAAARARLGLDDNARVLALLPGSRGSEIRLLAPRFLAAAQLLTRRDPALQVIVPMVNRERLAQFQAVLAQYPVTNLRCVSESADDESVDENTPPAWTVLAACDSALVASGTATLEAALFKRPMVISYVLSPWMRRIMAWKSGQKRPYLPWVGLPNVLAQASVVPELLQDDATPAALADALWQTLTDDAAAHRITERFTQMHHELLRDTPRLAAQAILQTAHA